MTRSMAAGSVATLVGAGLLGLVGCSRAPEPVLGTPESGAATASAPRTPAAGEPLQAYVWNCADGQTIRMRNLLRENAITIERHEGGRKLPRVVSASGAKYSDGSLTFWTKGDTAVLERAGSPIVDCRQDRHGSMIADAQVRGVAFRGTGHEPGWTVEIGPRDRLELVMTEDDEHHAFDGTVEGSDGGARTYTATRDDESIRVTLTAEPCTDDASGWTFDHRMVVEYGGRTYRGCAAAVR